MQIFDSNDNIILDISVDDNSYRMRAIKGDHNLILHYSLPEHLELPVGAYCIFQEETYTLMRPENLKMKHSRFYDYTVTFSSEQEKSKIWKFRNPVDGRLKFPLTAKPKEHLQMFVDNMNRRDTGWTVGDCIEDVEKLITYDHDFCWDALNKQAAEFDTEFEILGKRVSLKKVEYNKDNPLPLAYGKGNGFKPGIGRSNTSEALPVEILYVQGGDTNIDRSKYPSDEKLRAISNGCLLLPVGQTIAFDGEHFEGEDGFNQDTARHYQVDDLGLSIRNIDKELTSLAEDSLDRSDDYPKRIGIISRVDLVDKDKNFYDFIDNSIPDGLNYENYLIGDEAMTVIFQSGELAGREFDVKYYHSSKTTNGKTKDGRRFEIVPQEIDGIMMPGDSFVPQAGDTYAIFHVMLPDAYIRNDEDKSGASWDMFRAAARYLFENEDKKFSFTGELDSIWAKKNWDNIGGRICLGGYVKFTHDQIAPEGVLTRIISVKDYINKPHNPKIELSNDTVGGTVSSTLKQLGSTEVVIEENHKAAIQYTKRRFRDAKETIDMIEGALADNFTQRINPIAVETMSLLVGDERLQFQFVEAPGKTVAIAHNVRYNETTKQLESPAGTIQHMTIGIKGISSSHKANEYHYWSIPSYKSAILTEGNLKYYLYIKAEKNYSGEAGKGEFLLDTNPHKLEEGSSYYFLVGILNSEYDGERSFVTLYGFSEVLPGRITTDRIVSADGESYFDMLNSALKLKDKLQYNTNGDEQLLLKGTLVQSQSGDTAPIGCYRGVYNPEFEYYEGDMVIYESSGKFSLYRRYKSSATKGKAPTDTSYWQVQASPGSDGSNGDFYEYRYSVNGSITSAPSLTEAMKKTREPSGWGATVPSVGELQYLWQIVAKISGTDNSLISSWSTPVRVSPKDGTPGENGSSPALVFRGVFKESERYYGTPYRVDCVKNGNQFFVARTDAPGGVNGFLGKDGSTGNGKYWNPFGASFEAVATYLLLAENANIANLIFKDGKLISQRGVLNGRESDDFMAEGFVPNVVIDGITGSLSYLGKSKQPFKSWNSLFTESFAAYSTTYIAAYNAGGAGTTILTKATEASSGLRFCISNYKYTNNNGETRESTGEVRLRFTKGEPSVMSNDYYPVWENGTQTDYISIPKGEMVEFVCYGTISVLWGMIIMDRIKIAQ